MPKFQSIQAAHEILSDPEQRAKYDAERRKLGHGAGPGLRPTGPANFTNGRSPYATYGDWAPPPRRTARPAPAPTRPSYNYGHSGPETAETASRRTANFANQRPPPRGPPPKVPPRASDGAKDGADARANVFTAWQRMKQQQQQQQQRAEQAFSEEEFSRTTRAARDTASAHTGKPGLGRSNTTRTPKKAGFDPNAPEAGGWEPQAKRTSAYSAYAHTPRQSEHAPGTTSPVPPFAAQTQPPKTKPEPMKEFWSRNGEYAPFTEGKERLSTPYASHGGEKTYFDAESLRRSASTHNTSKLSADGAATSRRRESPLAGGARHRSASPSTRATSSEAQDFSTRYTAPSTNSARTQSRKNTGNVKTPFHFGYSSSSSESEEEKPSTVPSDHSRRPKAQAGKKWNAGDTPVKEDDTGSRTAPETPVNGSSRATPMYDTFSFSPIPTQNSSAKEKATYKPWYPAWSSGSVELDKELKRQNISASVTAQLPPWAMPSSVTPGRQTAASKPGASPYSATKDPTRKSRVKFVSHMILHETLSQAPFADNLKPSRFTIPHQDTTHAGRQSRSSENVSTAFSANDWHGKFEGSADFNPSSGSRKGSKSKAAPSMPTPRGTVRNPIDLSKEGFPIPPPPPNPPPGGPTFQPGTAPQAPGPVKFASEEWAKTFQEAKLFHPDFLDSSRSTSPVKSNSTATRRTKVGRGRKQSNAKATRPPGASVVDASDADEDEALLGKTTSTSNPTVVAQSMDDDAMEIDSESPVSYSADKGPRLVPTPPTRPEWREGTSTAATPRAIADAGGKVPASPVPSAVPNSASPLRPPPPPKVKQTQGAAPLNLNALRNVTPLAPAADGLQGMQDLSGTLPFESHASAHPVRTFQVQQLELPGPPKAPTTLPANVRITENQWRAYIGAISFYMGTWFQFNDKMLTHFNARHTSAKRFGTGLASTGATRLLEAMGEGSNEEGLDSYITGLQEDVRVRRHWDIACEKHTEAVEAFAAVKARVKSEGLVRL